MSQLFELPPLTYAFNALEPAIDAMTMEIHHDRHHAAYVTNLNKALESQPDLQGKGIEEILKNLDTIPEVLRTTIRNNGGGHANHSLYWDILTPGGKKSPAGAFEKALLAEFGTFDRFVELVSNAGMARFGSGWAWLVMDPSQKLKVYSTANQDSPLSMGDSPLLGMDVWEHAYYLKYQNRRADYIKAFLGVINWDVVSKIHEKASA
jgi:Fe-Mn family superoxide dismutase